MSRSYSDAHTRYDVSKSSAWREILMLWIILIKTSYTQAADDIQAYKKGVEYANIIIMCDLHH